MKTFKEELQMSEDGLRLEKDYDNTVVPEFKNEDEELLWKVQHNELSDSADYDWEDGEWD